MMENNWDNFLKNLGQWEGSFTSVSLEGKLLESTLSILNLEGFEENKLVKFRVRRFGPSGYNEPPLKDYCQEYRTLGKQNIFFQTGAFSKGSLQFAPYSEFGAEYGFVDQNRRLRFVQLYNDQGILNSLVLIREFRSRSDAKERPPLTVEQLLGQWKGTVHKVYSDWQPSETYSTFLEVKDIGDGRLQQQWSCGEDTMTTTARIEGNILYYDEGSIARKILLLSDGTSSNTPLEIKLRQPFYLELGWMVEDNQHQRLIRSYNDKGAWISASHVIEHRVC